MSTSSLIQSSTGADQQTPRRRHLLRGVVDAGRRVLGWLASLQLTVVLFATAIFLIYVGTLAQVEKDVWEVVHTYFRSWMTWIEFQVLLPDSFFPQLDAVAGGFWFPGGASIGVAMTLNLLAAHLIRFKIRRHGPLLVMGCLTILAGAAIAWLIISSGHNRAGRQDLPRIPWVVLWGIFEASLAALAIAAAVLLAVRSQWNTVQRSVLVLTATLLGGLAAWLFARGTSGMPSPASLRILWQLIQGGTAGLVLLAGCVMVFGKRAGIVLLHAGIGLMMFSEFFVSQYAVEGVCVCA